MGRSIHSLPTLASMSSADMIAYFSAAAGSDAKAPASALPISDAVQTALDTLRDEVMFGGAYIRAITLFADDATALAEIRAPSGSTGTVDLAIKMQAALDAAYLLYGSDQSGAGGHGVCMDLDPGTWTISTLKLKPGMALRGLSDRFEVRIKQLAATQAPPIDILGRGQNQDVVGRRTAVILERLDINANGQLDAIGDPINCINLRVDAANEGDDDSANRTGLIACEVQAGGATGWGLYNLKRGKIWLSKCQFSGNGLAPLLPNGKVGGLFTQGPDCFFHKTYCGNNGGIQMHIKSSATPSVVEVELGTSKQPDLYPTVLIERCTDVTFGGGGNCTGWIQVIGAEDDTAANEYDTECRITFYDFVITLKDKSFTKADNTIFTMNGAFSLENVRGVHIQNVRVKPATDDHVVGGHHYTNRPTNIVYIKGARTRATWFGPLPPLDDWNWPAGTPEVWPGTPPTNTYDSITNKPNQLLICTTDPTDTLHAWKYDWISFFQNGGIRGKTDGSAVQAGAVGEYVKSEQTTPQALTTGTILSLANIALTAGTWEIRGIVNYTGTAATVTSSEATVDSANNVITSANPDRYSGNGRSLTTVTGVVGTEKIGPFELKTASSVTRYINCRAGFSAGSVNVTGGIYARRVA